MSDHLEAILAYLTEELQRELPSRVMMLRHGKDICLYHSGDHYRETIEAARASNHPNTIVWLLDNIVFAVVQAADWKGPAVAARTVHSVAIGYEADPKPFTSCVSNGNLVVDLVRWVIAVADDSAARIIRDCRI